MKQIMSGISILALTVNIVISAVCPLITPATSTTYIPINPIDGENLWQITKRTADALDQIGPMTSTIATELNEFAYTSSLEYAHACYITQADLPYTINKSGVYYISESMSLGDVGGADLITIDADNVVLDFRGNTIKATNAENIVITLGFNNIVKNAVIDGSASFASIYIGWRNSRVENCLVSNNNGIGIYLGALGITAENCQTRECYDAGYYLETGDIVIKNCFSTSDMLGSPSTSSNASFHISDSAVTVESCYATHSGGHGFYILGSGHAVNNCYAFYCIGDGFQTRGEFASLLRCQAGFNGQDGFGIATTDNSGTSRASIIGCIAFRNTQAGFRNRHAANNFFFNCASYLQGSNNYVNVVQPIVTAGTITETTGYWANVSY